MTVASSHRPGLAIILAAGQGTRMRSEMPKILHPVASRPMLGHVLAVAKDAGIDGAAVVISPSITPPDGLLPEAWNARFFIQEQQLGTAHAVAAAKPAFDGFEGDVIVLYGDTPLITPQTVKGIREALEHGADIAILGFETDTPDGYGRIILDDAGHPIAIREDKDASQAERSIKLCNSGVMAFRASILPSLLSAIGNNNAKGEYYLTDALALAHQRGLKMVLITCPEEEVQGVNDRAQLAAAEAAMQRRLRRRALEGGATLIAPETVTLAWDTALAEDVTIEPNVFFGPGVTVEAGATIKSFSYIEGAQIGRGAIVGPFARIRPATRLAEGVKIGNFVEIKNANIENRAKVNHLTYIGDARVGAKANIGAGTITCNYDGFDKHRTDIGAGSFIGSNSALVAPVSIGDGAYIGSGSVITRDVSPDALALSRTAQTEVPGWAAKVRERRGRKRDHG